MNIKTHKIKSLFFTDLDKTLLNDEHEISENNLQAIQTLLSNQIEVVLASGRSYQNIKDNILKKYHLQLPVIALNGAQIYSHDGNLIQNHSIRSHNLHKIIDSCDREDCFYLLYDGMNIYTHEVKNLMNNLYSLAKIKSDNIDTILVGMQIYYNLLYDHQKLTTELKQQFKELKKDLLKIEIISHNKVFLEHLKKEMNSKLKVTSSYELNLEITHDNASKGQAVEFLCQYYGVDINETYGIGDHYNDLDMLSKVHFRIAVDNAIDELKKIVDYVTDSYDHDGFAKAVYKLSDDNHLKL